MAVSNVSALLIEDTIQNWTSTFNTGMLALVTLVKTSPPYLEKGKGSIIAISSVSGRDVDFTAPGPYGAFKASIVHYVPSSTCTYVGAEGGVGQHSVPGKHLY